MKERNKRVLVGMSGGIDSTATCLMLQEQGYEIVGVTMRVWGDEPQDARDERAIGAVAAVGVGKGVPQAKGGFGDAAFQQAGGNLGAA